MELQQYVLINDGTIIDIYNSIYSYFLNEYGYLIQVEEDCNDSCLSTVGRALFSSDDKLDVIGYKQMLEDQFIQGGY